MGGWGVGFYAVLETCYLYKYCILSIFKFVKILNHSPAQVLSNKKNRSSLRLLLAEIFLGQFLVLTHKGYTYFVPPLQICEVLNQCIKIKSSGKKVFDLSTNLLCPREESLQFFF
jgi:hypothetical protein